MGLMVLPRVTHASVGPASVVHLVGGATHVRPWAGNLFKQRAIDLGDPVAWDSVLQDDPNLQRLEPTRWVTPAALTRLEVTVWTHDRPEDRSDEHRGAWLDTKAGWAVHAATTSVRAPS